MPPAPLLRLQTLVGNDRLNSRKNRSIPVTDQFSMRPVAFVRCDYNETSQIPRGWGAKHDAHGTLEFLPELEPGLADVEGFSHLFVIWVFDRSTGFELVTKPPT